MRCRPIGSPHCAAESRVGATSRCTCRAAPRRCSASTSIPAARIGKGIFLDHATGLVVGETTVIEDDVSILQGVTLGGTGKETGDRHPKIRHGVLIGAGAKILGNIEIGHCARVAAGSVVLAPVPHNKTVAGVPARIVGEAGCAEPARDMNQILADKALRAPELRLVARLRGALASGKATPPGSDARAAPWTKKRSSSCGRFCASPSARRALQRRAESEIGGCGRRVSSASARSATIAVDDEDGDRSFSFEMKVPVERPGAAGLSAQAVRERQADDRWRGSRRRIRSSSTTAPISSASSRADDPKGKTFTLQMAILDIDLEDE